jgi:RHS repeat-associated protein
MAHLLPARSLPSPRTHWRNRRRVRRRASGRTVAYNLRFPGQIFDGQAGLHQNVFRDYDSAIGRYAQSDPIGLEGGINTYAYTLDNSIGLSDPRGLDVTININRQGYSSTGNSVYGTISATSTVASIKAFNGFSMENAHAGECGCKSPVPAGSYSAHVREDHTPNRIELIGVPGYANIQIHNGNYPQNFIGCFGVGTSRGTDFLGGTIPALNKLLALIQADGSGNITVNVSPAPFPGPATAVGYGLNFNFF